jgi:pimeloyl-ACP methyl ester carboxylesterase
MLKRVAVVAALAVVIAALTGCTPTSSRPQPAPPLDSNGETPIRYLRVPMTQFLQQNYYSQSVRWHECGEFECGTVKVPINWQDPSTNSIKIALVEHRATGARIGSLLVNPGGPGGSGVEFVENGVDYVVDSTVSKHYDVIGFDPRGVGKSAPVKCLSDRQQDAYLYAPTVGAVGSKPWIADQRKRARSLAAACLNNTGSLLGHIDTVSAAHDMDVIRAALGEKRLNYLGYSYGTELGSVYAGLYPKNIGRMVFDGPENPWDSSPLGTGDQQTVAFEDELDDYLRSCLAGKAAALAGADCPFSGSLHSAEQTLERWLTSADAHPIQNSDGRYLDGNTLATAIEEAMYSTRSWPDLTEALNEVKTGGAEEAFILADYYNWRDTNGSYEDNNTLANTAINCLEYGHAFDPLGDAVHLKKLIRDAPVLGPYNAYGDITCSGWKVGPAPFPEPFSASSSGPLLMVATTGDPATPYEEALDLSKQLVNSHLVTFKGEGHTAYDQGHSCVDKAVDNYLVAGTVPASDPECRD